MLCHCLVCVRLSHSIKDYLLTYLITYNVLRTNLLLKAIEGWMMKMRTPSKQTKILYIRLQTVTQNKLLTSRDKKRKQS